jgi:hypothetical protein
VGNDGGDLVRGRGRYRGAGYQADYGREEEMIEIFYVYQSGEQKAVRDMYWFWERSVHDINDTGGEYDTFLFEVFVDEKLVFCNAFAIDNSEKLYDIVMTRVHILMGAPPGPQEEDELDKLTQWAEKYEKAHFPLDR